jgi:hypothetical protein
MRGVHAVQLIDPQRVLTYQRHLDRKIKVSATGSDGIPKTSGELQSP